MDTIEHMQAAYKQGKTDGIGIAALHLQRKADGLRNEGGHVAEAAALIINELADEILALWPKENV